MPNTILSTDALSAHLADPSWAIVDARFDLARLATKWIFGTDWPGVPGPSRNAAALASLGLPDDILAGVLSGNAAKIFPGLDI